MAEGISVFILLEVTVGQRDLTDEQDGMSTRLTSPELKSNVMNSRLATSLHRNQ